MPQIVIRSFRTARLLFALFVFAGAAASCVEWDRSTSTSINDVRLFIFDVRSANGTSGERHEGVMPSGSGPTLSATVPSVVLKGGSSEVTFTSATPFTRVLVGIQGYPGYFDVPIGAPTTSATVLIIWAQQVGGPTFSLLYAGGNGAAIGVGNTASSAFLGNGTGQVQVNITWNSKADVDLYLVDPFGDEIFYAQRFSNSGGELDIDSNAGCARDGPRAENIFYPFGVVPPPGEYVIRVNYWSECGEASTDYVVTVRIGNAAPKIYRGTLTGPGLGGMFGAGKRVDSFVFPRPGQ